MFNSLPDSHNFQDSLLVEGTGHRIGAIWFGDSLNHNLFSGECRSNMFLQDRPNPKDSGFNYQMQFDAAMQSQGKAPTSFLDFRIQEFSLEGEAQQQSKKLCGSDVSFGPTEDEQMKSWRGLRLLSLKVKKIIQEDVDTSYKKVADKLVNEMKLSNKQMNSQKLLREEQNVKRRVYDALNVLIAADVIVKKGKVLKATGMTNLFGKCSSRKRWEHYSNLEQTLRQARTQFLLKKNFRRELITRVEAIDWLIKRNEKQCQDKTEREVIQQFNFPILALKHRPGLENEEVPISKYKKLILRMTKENKTLKVYSKHQIEIMGDLELVVLIQQINLKVKEE